MIECEGNFKLGVTSASCPGDPDLVNSTTVLL